jgi:hypothetical protein
MRIVIPNQPAGTNLIIKARSKSGADYSEWSRNYAVTTSGDTIAPKTPANPVGSMAGSSFILKWDPVTQSSDNSPASDLDRYEIKITSSGSIQTTTFATRDVRFEFPFSQNVALFGTPQANVQMAVRAVDTAGNASAYTSTVSQTNAAPAAPTGLTGASGVNLLTFSWNAVADLDLKEYHLYSGLNSTTQSTLVWTGTALTANIQITDTTTDRWYKVVAVDVFNTESASSNVFGPIKPTSPVSVDTTAPAVPTGLAGTLTNAADGLSASMAVSWTAVSDTDLDSYVLAFRQTASPVNDWQYVYVDKSLTSTTIQGLVPYKAYDIRIRSKDFSANYSNWTTIVNVTAQANTAPATPTGLAITTGKDNIRLSWNENTETDVANNAGTYDVTVATNSGFTTGVLQYRTGATSISINGLAENTTYYARVRAVDSQGATSAYSASVNAATGAFTVYNKYTVSTTAPSSPNTNDVWMDTTSGFEKYWTGSAWATTGNVSLSYISAQGSDLITNGTALMKNNYNFSSFNFSATDAPTGANGSFVIKTTTQQSAQIDENLSFDPAKKYKFSFQARQTVSGQTNTMYGFIAPYDAFNLAIQPYNYMYITGTTTTLAAPLNPGDTTITLTSSANWYGSASKPAGGNTYLRNMIFWDYVDAAGRAWPVGSYSRNVLNPGTPAWADGGISGNVITLTSPYSGPAKPAGTSVSNATSGGSYMYMPSATSVVVPETWTTYSDVFTAGTMSSASQATSAGGGATWALGVPPGTAKVRVGWLLNYPAGGTGKHAIAAVSFSTAGAAQDTADTAYATANGKNKIIRSTSAASGTTGYVAGDLWWQIDGSGNAIAQWKYSGTAWVSEQLASGVFANVDANKITAGTGFINTLNIGTGGAIQSAGYTAGTSGFKLSTSGLVIEGSGNTVSASVLKGGTVTATTLTIGAGGLLVVDSTAAIRSNNYAIGSTGYRMDSSGLEVNDGTIDAKTLKTGSAVIGDLVIGRSADSLGTVRSFDYVAGTTGWKIGKGLFEVNQGVIKAPALQIQSGASNLERPEYSAFEFTSTFYNGKFGPSNGTTSIQTVGGVQGSQFLRLSTTTAAASTFYLGDSATDYHISVEAGKTYIVSAWMKASTATAVSAALRFKYNDGTSSAVPTPVTLTSGGSFTRYSWAITVPAGITNALVEVDNNTATAGVGIDIDGVMVEQQVGGLTTPSTYVMPGMTSVDGAIVRTGQMVSNATVTVNGVSQPAWSINMAGGAQFGDAAIRGSLVVGPTTPTEYATNGNMESTSLSAFTLYANPYMSTTSMVRTTTAGEVINGTGSLKFTGTDTADSFSSMGFEVALGSGIPDSNSINFTFKLRYLSTTTVDEQCYALVQLIDSGGIVIKSKPVVFTDNTNFIVQGNTKTASQAITVPIGYTAAKMRIVAMPRIAGTHRFIFDDISINASADLGASSISSGNYIQNGAGWRLNSSGVGDFNDITIRGIIGTGSAGKRLVLGDKFDTGGIYMYSGNAYEWSNGFLNVADDASITLYAGYIGNTVPATPTGSGAGGAGGIGSSYSMGTMTIGKIPNNTTYYGFQFAQTKAFMVDADNTAYMSGYDGIFYISNVAYASSDVSSAGTLLQGTSAGPMKITQDNQTMTLLFTETATSAVQNKVVLDTNGVTLNAEALTLQNDWTPNSALANLKGNVADQMTWVSRSVDMLSGGGVISVDASYNIKWTQRFMAVALGNHTNTFTNGYLAITMPAVGATIPGYGGAPASTTVTSSGIALASWCVLYYEPTFGGSGATSDDSAFRMVSYTSTFTVPAHWIPIALRNTDLGMVYFGNGIGYTPWTDIPLSGSWAAFDTIGSGHRNPQYRKTSFNEVQCRGLIKHATTTTTGTFATLPTGFRPTETEMFLANANAGVARIDVLNTGVMSLNSYIASGNAGFVSLAQVKFFAD